MKKLICALILFTFPVILFAGERNDPNMGFDNKNIDSTVSPTVDFYKYAIGSWLENNPIPDEWSSWGSFEALYESNSSILKQILENAAGNYNPPKGSKIQMVGDYYYAGMDTIKIEKEGYKPIIPYLKMISGMKSKDDLLKITALIHLRITNPLFWFGAQADSKNSKMNIAQFSQDGLGLPDRDYYLGQDKRSKEIRDKYVIYMQKLFALVGENKKNAKKDASKVMEIETRLAKASFTNVELRDPVKNYNKMSFDSLRGIASGINWNLFFRELGINTPEEFDVNQPEFIKEVGKMIQEIPLSAWKPYLKWNIIRSSAPYLSSAFVNESFQFRQKFLYGAKVLRPRWKRIMAADDNALGELIGQLYIEKNFPPEAKERALKIVRNLIVAIKERINNLDWMGEETKKAALVKLASLNVKIGYPDKWKDYSNVKITRDSYFENDGNASDFLTRYNLAKIGKPVDKTEWEMNPQTVNAYYHPVRNEIVFPAAILQPPFFNINADDAVNYGAMGVVIGHEISHGFDDQGRQYDADGNLKDWWTENDSKKFNEKAKMIVDQFNSYVPIDTFHVNGELTQGENIGDLGGLNISLTAFKNSDEYKSGERVNGFTPMQRFFLSWAQIWRQNIRDEYLKLLIKTDPHTPNKYRINGPMSNLPEFWDAFNVKPGDPMRRPDATLVKIW
jgi:putative endopeptidase